MHRVRAAGPDIADPYVDILRAALGDQLPGHQVAGAGNARVPGIQHKVDKVVFVINRGQEYMHAAVFVHRARAGNAVQAPVNRIADTDVALPDADGLLKSDGVRIGRPAVIQL